MSNGKLGCETETTYEFEGDGSGVNSKYDSIDNLLEDMKKEYDVVKLDFKPTITVTPTQTTPKPDDSKTDTNSFKVRVKYDGGLNFRSAPGTENSKVISGVIPNGQELVITKTDVDSKGDEWGYTTYSGAEGWVILKYTEKVGE